MVNRYRCRAFYAGESAPFYTCVVMCDTEQQAVRYVMALTAKMQQPAFRVEAEQLFKTID